MEVQLEQVRVGRDGRLVLNIPALRLHGGRTTAVLGPNGSGKTTLLRVIAGLERPCAGRVVPSAPVAYVFQEQVFVRASVRDNLELGLRLRRVAPAERRRRIDDAAALLGIAHLLERRADRLSGGEGRRVSLARALCLRSPLVLLDEPLEGLDDRTYSRLLGELPQVLAAFAATTILVTHNRDEALRLAEDLVILVDGRVQAAGSKWDVAANPRTAAVAEVLGYYVLDVERGRLAVPPGALRIGGGAQQFVATVEGVVDLVDSRELVGRIGDVRVRVGLPSSSDAPEHGSRLLIHAERFYELRPT